ncbi:uncharacterized protein LOC133534166 [Cydia pomonella]|uniref:uncharacterized protein LOC133534166 n=1 Tax=Cydia pomonella TaxID=82600 RepID=UPI002ADD8172|nr:uncharacterized protein LOC133534166 [Cydia pomonella]
MLSARDTLGGCWVCTCNTELCYEKNINEFPGTRRKENELRTLIPVNTVKHIAGMRNIRWSPENFTNTKKCNYPGLVQYKRTAWIQGNDQQWYEMKLIGSDRIIMYLRDMNRFQTESTQNKMDGQGLDKMLLIYLQILAHSTSNLLFKTAERNLSQNFLLVSGRSVVNELCPSGTCLVNMSTYSSMPENMYFKTISNTGLSPLMEYSKFNKISKNSNTYFRPYLVQSSLLQKTKSKEQQNSSANSKTTNPSSIITWVQNFTQPSIRSYKKKNVIDRFDLSVKQNSERPKNLISKNKNLSNFASFSTHKPSPFFNLKGVLGPYAQIQIVYNVMEQAATEVKEKGTSQQFKQKSQGIGSGSVSGGNDSSSASSKRRTIKIESGVSFSVEFIDKGKSGTESTVSSPEPETGKKKRGKEGKKSLHRCLCTTSFPTDDKKLKNRPCDSGVCVPGECSPSECFKRLQQKYGSKKKQSDSDVSSSQASQTRKKKEKEGKILKEKGSSSISKYKESVEEKPPPKPEKSSIVTSLIKCCKTLQFWKKDKHIELKPGVMGTDISVKDETKTFGSNAASQSGKTNIPKKDKKSTEKDGKGETVTVDAKTSTGKKGKKEKGKKVTEKKKDTTEEVKTETKATGKEMKKARPLKPYECEPGVCTPKVCSPKECYERKYPPPPPVELTNFMKFKNCVLKICCKRPAAEEKAGSPLDAATQSPKSAPEKTAGVTVYQEKGTSGPKAGKKQKGETPGVTSGVTPPVGTATTAKVSRKSKKGAKQQIDTGVQLPVDSGDVQKPQQQSAYPGMQYYQTIDPERMTKRQGLNIGSECECSVEFYKMLY